MQQLHLHLHKLEVPNQLKPLLLYCHVLQPNSDDAGMVEMVSAYLGLVAAREDCIDEASMTRDRLKSAT